MSLGNLPFVFSLVMQYAYIYAWMHVYKTAFKRSSSQGRHHMVCNGKTKPTSLRSIIRAG